MGLSPDASAWVAIVVTAVGFAAGYALSLWLHPERNCPRCKGQGKHKGSLFTASRRQCARCGGKGREGRWGTIIWERAIRGRPSRFRSP